MGSTPPPPPVSDDYSAEKTVIQFPRPIPLLRASRTSGNPSTGRYFLAFKSPRDWATAYDRCKAELISQCESGARIGCSISASEKCKPPWWKFLLGNLSKQDLIERAKCEDSEMEACFATAKEKCVIFAKQKCAPAFENSWVELGVVDLGIEDWKEAFRLISRVCFVNEKKHRNGILGVGKSWSEFGRKYVVSHVKGKDLLSSDDAVVEEYMKMLQTLDYPPPEASLNATWYQGPASVTSKYDMWSAGVVIMELILGSPHVFQISSKTQALLEKHLNGLSDNLKELAYRLRALMGMCILLPGVHLSFRKMIRFPNTQALRLVRDLLQWDPGRGSRLMMPSDILIFPQLKVG